MPNSYSSDIINYFLNNEEIDSVTMLFENDNEHLNKLNNTIKTLDKHGVEVKIIGFTTSQLQVEFISTDETKEYLDMINKWNEIPSAPLFNYQWLKES